MLLPKIIIRHGFLLDPLLREYFILKQVGVLQKKNLIDQNNLIKNIEDYKKEWQKYEDKILKALLDLLPIKFLHNVVDVYVVSYLPRRGTSSPVMIEGDISPREFVSILTHEIIHFFLENNNIIPEILPVEIFEEMFPEEKDTKTRNHIIINAVQKYILLDVIGDPASHIDVVNRKTADPMGHKYQKAWDIVEKNGYMKLINEFKNKIALESKGVFIPKYD